MDQNKSKEFRLKIERRMNTMDAKLSFMREGLEGFQSEFEYFQQEISDFMQFAAGEFIDHGQRSNKIEKHLNR
ncbi:MAG: hypothetical protein WA958_05680 [Tunicatimonas sp.]